MIKWNGATKEKELDNGHALFKRETIGASVPGPG